MECFNVMLVRPQDFIHHDGYSGSARQLCSGLRRLGYPARVAENEIVWDATNILVGVQNLEPELIETLPANTIVYNVEMMVSGSPFLPALSAFIRRFETWDYSAANVAAWRAAGVLASGAKKSAPPVRTWKCHATTKTPASFPVASLLGP